MPIRKRLRKAMISAKKITRYESVNQSWSFGKPKRN